jgi:hypothetical protein
MRGFLGIDATLAEDVPAMLAASLPELVESW